MPKDTSHLIKLALLVAAYPPERFNIHGSTAYVPRSLIKDMRQECERLGLDWRKVKGEMTCSSIG